MKTKTKPHAAAPASQVLIQLPWRLDIPNRPEANVILIRGKPHRWRRYGRDIGDQVASVVWSGGNSAAGPQHYPREVAFAHAHLLFAAPDLREALKLHLAFLDSLPKGWLAHTVADIGFLNDAYIASRAALAKSEGAA